MTILSLESAHEELVREAIGGRLTEEDALLWMVLLHTHSVQIWSEFVEEPWQRHAQDGNVLLHPGTQRQVASVIAALWGKIKQKRTRPLDETRSRYLHWYYEFNTRVPYETVAEVPAQLRKRLDELRDLLARDPRVFAVIPD